MRSIVQKKDRIINATKEERKERIPVIYIRYYQGIVMYIGETRDINKDRPFRVEPNNPYDRVRVLNASANRDIRRKWEAKLIVRLQPKTQRISPYLRKAELDYKCSTDSNFIRGKNTHKVFEHICGRYDTIYGLYLNIIQHSGDVQRVFLKEHEKVMQGEEKFKYNLAQTFENLGREDMERNIRELKKPNVQHFIWKCAGLYKTCSILDTIPRDAFRLGTPRFYRQIQSNVLDMYKTIRHLAQQQPHLADAGFESLNSFKKNGESSFFNATANPIIGLAGTVVNV